MANAEMARTVFETGEQSNALKKAVHILVAHLYNTVPSEHFRPTSKVSSNGNGSHETQAAEPLAALLPDTTD